MYKSMQADETEKIRTPYLKYLIPVVFLLVVGFYGISQSFVGRALSHDDTSTATAVVSSELLLESQKNINPKSDLPYVRASFVMQRFPDGSFDLQVFDPVAARFLSYKAYPYPLKFEQVRGSLRVFVQIPKLSKEKQEN